MRAPADRAKRGASRRLRPAFGHPLAAAGMLAAAVAGTLVATSGTSGATSALSFHPVAVPPVSLSSPAVILTPGQNVPDPFVTKVDGLYYMFASEDGFFGPTIQLIVSSTLTSWSGPATDAMPTLPRWAEVGFTWSPDVMEIDGHYVMWFNAALASSGSAETKCIGVATAASVVGPYRSTAAAPLVCQLDHLGSIDPRVMRAPDGRLWLLWKSDDNADVNGTTRSTIWAQRLTADGLEVVGRPVPLLTPDLPWEGRIVESPDMVFAAGHYWLFFSGNWFNQPAYALGVAECAGPSGPCDPTALGPWLSSNAQGAGPGEESLFFDGSRWWMLYAPFAVDYQSVTPRPAAMVRLQFGPDGPRVLAPGTAQWSAPDKVPKPKPFANAAAPPGCGSMARACGVSEAIRGH